MAAADLFSSGVVLYLAVSCHKPFGGSKMEDVTKSRTCTRQVDFSRHFVNLHVSPQYKQFVRDLVKKSPFERPSAKGALSDPYLEACGNQDLVPQIDRFLEGEPSQCSVYSFVEVPLPPVTAVAVAKAAPYPPAPTVSLGVQDEQVAPNSWANRFAAAALHIPHVFSRGAGTARRQREAQDDARLLNVQTGGANTRQARATSVPNGSRRRWLSSMMPGLGRNRVIVTDPIERNRGGDQTFSRID
ncbi:unnamed protein product [Polarella glacialis]|uniref:Protein kinase domain-containing protein n=3 Tax=Polarella glacialis TaxID=89957 RepID=A0A813GAX0_POLGL|nr:unnamed protein product [Polarella glacialis]